jgi:nitrogen-specific signal transduction histidine kinase
LRTKSGSRLGLSVATIFLERYGGTLEIDSGPVRGIAARANFPGRRGVPVDKVAAKKWGCR